ncbi:MAG: KR prefix domain-containing protein, partial [Blastocatellia bacterium]
MHSLKAKNVGTHCWVLFCAPSEFGEVIAARLRKLGQVVICVRAGSRYSNPEDGVFVIDPANASHYSELFAALKERDSAPRKIIHLWSLTSWAARDSSESGFTQDQNTGLLSLLRIGAAIEQNDIEHNVDVEVVCDGLHRLQAGDAIDVTKATILASCGMLSVMSPNLSCRCTDIVLEEQGDRLIRQADTIIAELLTKANDARIAYRDDQRWVETFERVRPGEGDLGDKLKEGGTYVIVDSSGESGLELAAHLSENARLKIGMVHTQSLPPREEWESRLVFEDELDHATLSRRVLQSIDRRARALTLVSGDLTSVQSLECALSRIEQELGNIDGIFHVLGLHSSDETVPNGQCGYGYYSRFVKRNVDELLNLSAALRRRQIGFCIILSSNASVLGGPESAASSAVSLIGAAIAAKESGRFPARWSSIETDAFTRENTKSGHLEENDGARAEISREEFAQVLSHAISLDTARRVIVSPRDLHERLTQRRRAGSRRGPRFKPQMHGRPDLGEPYIRATSRLERTIANLWQELLGVEPIG